MNKQDIINFFDYYAPLWDQDMIIDDELIKTILDNIHLSSKQRVLDVACGTGIMFKYYLGYNVASITGIDISPKMIEIAKSKFNDSRITLVCDDILEYETKDKYDAIVVYNAYPHFDDGDELISKLASLLNDHGYLIIAHGFSRDMINRHHNNVSKVSKLLPEINELKELVSKYLEVELTISNDMMYQITAYKHK